jgi:hypothetical protein
MRGEENRPRSGNDGKLIAQPTIPDRGRIWASPSHEVVED